MGLIGNLAAANAGVTALATSSTSQQNAILIAQNNRIIELLTEQNAALQYLAKQKAYEVSTR